MKTFKLYEPIRPQEFSFSNKPRGRRLSVCSFSAKTYQNKLNEAERLNKMQYERIQMLERTVQSLLDELKTMQNALVGRNSIHPALIGDSMLKAQLVQVEMDLKSKTTESDLYKLQVEELGQHKTSLETSLRKYRKLASENKLGINSQQSQNQIRSQKFKHSLIENTESRTLNSYVNQLSKTQSVEEVLNVAMESLKNVLGCKTCTVFISTNKPLGFTVGECYVGSSLFFSYGNGSPCFSKAEEAFSGFCNSEEMVTPVFINKKFVIVFQCEQISLPFDHMQELGLSVVLNLVKFKVQVHKTKKAKEGIKEKLEEFTSTVSALAKSRSFSELACTVDSILPSFCKFERAVVVFFDESNRELFTLAVKNRKGVRVSKAKGLTGETLRLATMKVYKNLRSKERFFEEIDNVHMFGDLDDCIFACLMGPASKNMGVLQLVNKIDSNIVPLDIKLAGDLSILLGNLIHSLS